NGPTILISCADAGPAVNSVSPATRPSTASIESAFVRLTKDLLARMQMRTPPPSGLGSGGAPVSYDRGGPRTPAAPTRRRVGRTGVASGPASSRTREGAGTGRRRIADTARTTTLSKQASTMAPAT